MAALQGISLSWTCYMLFLLTVILDTDFFTSNKVVDAVAVLAEPSNGTLLLTNDQDARNVDPARADFQQRVNVARQFQEPEVQDRLPPLFPLPVDDDPWSQWSECEAGRQTRQRASQSAGSCAQASCTETRPCQDGPWLAWGQWSGCYNNNRVRSRICIQPPCEGDAIETSSCLDEPSTPSPPDTWAEWSSWTVWSQCEDGLQVRRRVCQNGDCPGQSSETRVCEVQNDQPDSGLWMSWSEWSTCSDSSQFRTRSCRGTSGCVGGAYETRMCADPSSVTDGDSSWGAWSACQGMVQVRFRGCTVTNNGQCSSSVYETRPCQLNSLLPVDTFSRLIPSLASWSTWNNWSAWSSCSLGVRQRTRSCQGGNCGGQSRETSTCYVRFVPGAGTGSVTDPINTGQSGWEKWGMWTPFCLAGRRWRYRICRVNTTSDGQCTGPVAQNTPC